MRPPRGPAGDAGRSTPRGAPCPSHLSSEVVREALGDHRAEQPADRGRLPRARHCRWPGCWHASTSAAAVPCGPSSRCPSCSRPSWRASPCVSALGRSGLIGQPCSLDSIPVHDVRRRAGAHLRLDAVLRARHRGRAALARGVVRRRAATLGATGGRRSAGSPCRSRCPASSPGPCSPGRGRLGEFGATITFNGNYPGTTQTMPTPHLRHPQPDPTVARTLSLMLLVVSIARARRAARPTGRWAGDARSRSTSGPDRVQAAVHRRARRGAGRDRPERRRQEHASCTRSPGSSTSGRVQARRHRPGRPRRSRERRVGYVFQDQLLFPHLSALDNVAFGRRSRGEAPARGRGGRPRLARSASASPSSPTASRASSPAARPSGSRSPGRSPPTPTCCCSTSPSPASTSPCRWRCGIELGRHLRDFPGIALLVTHDAIDALTLADRVLVLDGRPGGAGRPAGRGRRRAAHPARRPARRAQPRARRRRPDLVHPRRGDRVAGRAGGLVAAALARADRDPRAARRRRTTAWCTPPPTCSPT